MQHAEWCGWQNRKTDGNLLDDVLKVIGLPAFTTHSDR